VLVARLRDRWQVQLARVIAGGALAAALAFLLGRSGEHPAPASPGLRGQPAALPAPVPHPTAPAAAVAARAAAATPALPGDPPFRDQDFVVTTEMQDGPMIVLRSSGRAGRDLAIELAAREPLPAGKRLFAIVSVSDGLGNTVMDCTWRDVEITGDAGHKLDCELPADVALPLTISGHQLPAPSFVESPQVVAIDRRAQ
jgi:hypothetical protein